MSRQSMQAYFESVASIWDYWHSRNNFYHMAMQKLVQGMTPPGLKILELGSGTGDLLASLKPGRGAGFNLADGLTELARRKYPHLEFHTVAVDRGKFIENFSPDIVIMTNMLDYVYDIWELLEDLKPLLHDHTLIVVTTNNPLWAPLLRLASKLRLRIPDSVRNYITNKDIAGVLKLQDFDIVEEGLTLPVPVRIPVMGDVLNTVLPEIPGLRYLSSIQYIAARPRVRRPPLSCSVIIPCHNEADNIAECIRRVPNMGAWTEIIVVDDGSKDETRQRVREVMHTDSRVRLIAFDQNQGKANAVYAGFDVARGDVLMILDADMAVEPEELPKFLKPLQEGSADFVNGTRLVYPMHGKAMRSANFLGNKGFCYLASFVMRQRISDTLCGTKVLFQQDYLRMPRGGKERWGDFDLLFGAARLRLRMLEIPVHYQERRAGQSKMRVMIDGWRFLWACWQGWRMMRFPDTVPWMEKPEPVSGWHEIISSAS